MNSKEIFRFIYWLIKRIDAWQISMALMIFIIFMSIMGPKELRIYFSLIQIVISSVVLFKLIVWDIVKRNWQLYKKERNKLFDIIKDSEE